MSTTPLTLPTVEELRAAFPQATKVQWEQEAYLMLYFGGRRVWCHLQTLVTSREYYCTAKAFREKGGATHPSDWKQCILDALANTRAQLVKEAEEAQAAVAALDEAMKETTCPSSK